MSIIVGTAIPDPLYTRIVNYHKWGILRIRRCRDCGWRWTTVEVALTPKWPPFIPPERCPATGGTSRVLAQINLTDYTAGKKSQDSFPTKGELEVYQYGGQYRRRECFHCASCFHNRPFHKTGPCYPTHNHTKAALPCDCQEFQPCIGPKGKIRRWTTGEFSVHGAVVKDISRCPECGGRSYGKVPNRYRIQKALGYDLQWRSRP